MRPFGRLTFLTSAVIALFTGFAFADGQTPPPAARQATPARPAAGANQMPRTPDGKPDFSGIWQALNTAAWDIQDHSSSAASFVGMPPGRGVVEGNEIPYKPEALAQKKENFEKWFVTAEGYSVGATTAWEKHAMWDKLDKPLQVFRTAARKTRIFGYAGPSTAKSTEAFTKYIVTDMYAKAVQGMGAEDAVKWAGEELRKIYG